MTVTIDGITIGSSRPPYIIAEISGNHNGDLNTALKLIDAAKASGADAVKIQTYTPDCLTLNTRKIDFKLKTGLWQGSTLYELYKTSMTPLSWHEALFSQAKKNKLTIFSSPFSVMGLEFLDRFDPVAYKIASNEANDHYLVEEIAKRNKPVIVSTGTSTFADIKDTLSIIHKCGNQQTIVLYCVSQYPTKTSDANLKTLDFLKSELDVIVGLSDHSISHTVAVTATALGASVIEKHLTLNRSAGGPDDAFSLEPSEFSEMSNRCKECFSSIGKISFPTNADLEQRSIFTRQLWSKVDIKKETCLAGRTCRA